MPPYTAQQAPVQKVNRDKEAFFASRFFVHEPKDFLLTRNLA